MGFAWAPADDRQHEALRAGAVGWPPVGWSSGAASGRCYSGRPGSTGRHARASAPARRGQHRAEGGPDWLRHFHRK